MVLEQKERDSPARYAPAATSRRRRTATEALFGAYGLLPRAAGIRSSTSRTRARHRCTNSHCPTRAGPCGYTMPRCGCKSRRPGHDRTTYSRTNTRPQEDEPCLISRSTSRLASTGRALIASSCSGPRAERVSSTRDTPRGTVRARSRCASPRTVRVSCGASSRSVKRIAHHGESRRCSCSRWRRWRMIPPHVSRRLSRCLWWRAPEHTSFAGGSTCRGSATTEPIRSIRA